jgi:transposase
LSFQDSPRACRKQILASPSPRCPQTTFPLSFVLTARIQYSDAEVLTCTHGQPLLLAPSLQDWLPDDRLARFIAEVIGAVNLLPMLAVYHRKDCRGAEGHHPEMLTSLLLFGYATGLTSSRRIEKATYGNVAFRWWPGGDCPSAALLTR